MLKLISVDYTKSLRSLNFTMSNPNLLEGKQLFRAIYNTLMNSEEFTEFGDNKIIILSCTLEDNKSYNTTNPQNNKISEINEHHQSFNSDEIETIQNYESLELQILEVNVDENLRCLKINMINNQSLNDKELFQGIFNTIMNLDEFINFSYEKIIILSVILISGKEQSLHSNNINK
jgi:hypothetical protein